MIRVALASVYSDMLSSVLSREIESKRARGGGCLIDRRFERKRRGEGGGRGELV